MTKRQKIVIASILAAGLSFVAMVTDLGPGLVEVVIAMGLVYLVATWALQPDIEGVEFATLLALPLLLTAGVVLTAEFENLPVPWKYFLPPSYGAGMYLILLAENIFNISEERQVPLLRAAQTIGYLLTLGATFLVATLIFAKHMPAWANFLSAFLVGGMAVGQALWQVQLGKTNIRKLVLDSIVSGLSVGELALVISFWPIHPLQGGVAVTTLVYVLIGMIQHHWQENLTRRALLEYLVISATVFLLLLASTSWSG